MKKIVINVNDVDMDVVIYETKRQKDILDQIDCLLEAADLYGYDYSFSDDYIFIEYKDGTTFEAGSAGIYGAYKKKGIAKIIYVNANDTWVYGKYEVNEYGCVA